MSTHINRPARIIFDAYDPFDDRHLLSDNLQYCPRDCAKGKYREYVQHMVSKAKFVWSDVLEGRDPLITVKTEGEFKR